ncbi:MAG TPA: glutamate formimidoyltransferase [Candidatus Coatesbacteria bacterium]|nr:glutamate formimidoyltransferase [Candidatus Coatesbacteria bacterium]
MAALIEWVPNISEGRRLEVVEACIEPLRSIRGVKLLDYSSDPDHNRSVITCVGGPEGLKEATLALYARAVELIDMKGHSGEHSRIGAVDVCPYVPVRDATMADCDALAKECARAVAERFNLPVYLYRESASAPHRQSQSDIRRGEFEGLAEKMKDPLWKPDFGPDKPHPTAGATIIGARPFLIAFNVNLGTTDVRIGKRIAKAVRGSSGGFVHIQAAGFYLEDEEEGPVRVVSYDAHGAPLTHHGAFTRKTGMVQISMNFLDYTKTPLFRVVETIRREAARYGVPVIQTELVGLAPADAFLEAARWYMQVDNLKNAQIIDFQI